MYHNGYTAFILRTRLDKKISHKINVLSIILVFDFKKLANVFVPNEWCNMVSKASRKFMVVGMNQNDFKSIKPMSDLMRDNISGIRNMQWLHFEKSTPFSLFYKETLNNDMEYHRLDLKKC